MMLDKIILMIIFGLFDFILFFAITVFYQNSKQNRQHEKEILKMEIERESTKDSIKENEQLKELLTMLKDYYN